MELHKHIWWLNEFMEDVCKICKRTKEEVRSDRLSLSIDQMLNDNAELLEKIGSDYDENGVPYWEK